MNARSAQAIIGLVVLLCVIALVTIYLVPGESTIVDLVYGGF